MPAGQLAPPSTDAPLAQVPPDEAPPEPAEAPLLNPPPIAAAAGNLSFMVEAKELQGALNLIRRVSVPGDKKLSLVQIECRGKVVTR